MPLTPTQKKHVRDAISDYCHRAEQHQLAWHYTQMRPFAGYGVPPEQHHANDCSGYVALVYDWAMHKAACYMASPLGAPHGWGYTGSEIQWLTNHGKKIGANYLVGDIAINGATYATTVHTFVCTRPGTATTSLWSSNGNENAPNPVALNYHPVPLAGVWRHPALL